MAHVQAPPRERQAARPRAELGMRRIGWVRIVLKDDGSAVCHVTGTGHRLPIVRRVPLATALSLAAEGVPCVVRAARRQAENRSSD